MRGAVQWMKARKEGKDATPEAGEFGLVTSKQLLWQRPPAPSLGPAAAQPIGRVQESERRRRQLLSGVRGRGTREASGL